MGASISKLISGSTSGRPSPGSCAVLVHSDCAGDALAKATGFCPGKELLTEDHRELVDWFFDCDKYPFDKQLSLLEYARCMKEPDCPENFTDSADEKPADNTQENNTQENNNKEDGEPFFTSAQIYDMIMAGATMDDIKEAAQYG